jgi:thiamine-monophosphate kinase
LKFALHGGDDYELLFTARREKRIPAQISGIPTTCIGEIKPGRKMSIISESGKRSTLKPEGWQHFRDQ